MVSCMTCELVERRDRGEAPPWDAILRTDSWDVVHAFGTSIEGWLVLVVRRHITAVADMSDAEAGELGVLIKKVSAALAKTTGCEKTYVVQFAEAEDHPHVHVHVIPRAADHPPELRGPRVFAALGASPEDEVSEERRNAVAAELSVELSP